MHSLEITEPHSSSIEILKKQIVLRKAKAEKDYTNNLSNLYLVWKENKGIISGKITYPNYGIYDLCISGVIILDKTTLTVKLESGLDFLSNKLLRPFIEAKIREEIRNTFLILLPTNK